MTPDEAIKTTELYLHDCFTSTTSDHAKAIKLGIEALKAWRRLKQGHQFTTTSLLPGETPDNPPNRSLHHIKEVLESPLGREPKG